MIFSRNLMSAPLNLMVKSASSNLKGGIPQPQRYWVGNMESIESPMNIDQLDALRKRYNVDPNTCRHDSEVFLAEALQKSMLRS